MKKICIILAMILSFCGCFGEAPETPVIPENPEIFPEESESEEPRKIFLPLKNMYLEEVLELPDSADVFGTRVNIPAMLPERNEESDSNVFPVLFWEELVEEIRKDYPEFDPADPGWKAIYNFFAADGTAGMLKINYYIAENIITDKAIIGTVENGVITRLSYTNINFEADEEAVIAKAKNFLASTSQTKKIFEEGEEFLSEETLFHYYYPLETLVYSYQLFFLYGPEGEQVVNNDWGYECIVE